MKTVFPRREVAHRWAAQSQPEGRNSGSTYRFEGDTLYSYQTAIARLIGAEGQGHVVALISRNGYSSTTNVHQSYARRAVTHFPTFLVPGAPRGAGRDSFDPFAVMKRWEGLILRKLAEWRSAGARKRPRLAQEFDDEVRSANRFMVAFDLPTFHGPSAQGQSTGPQFMADLDKWAAHLRRTEDRREANRAEWSRLRGLQNAHAEANRAAWLAGASTPDLGYLDGDLMRLVPGHPETVETTQGASVPTAHVRRLAPIVLGMIARGQTYRLNGYERQLQFGPYILNEIRADGTVRVGCHNFKRAELERFAAVLGVVAGVAGCPLAPAGAVDCGAACDSEACRADARALAGVS